MSRRRSTNTQLILRLLQGELPSEDWHRWAASRKSLHVRISKLRAAGFPIESIETGRWAGAVPIVAYRLVMQ